MIGRTATGRAMIEALALNRERVVIGIRAADQTAGRLRHDMIRFNSSNL
jgi:hypothetical protein